MRWYDPPVHTLEMQGLMGIPYLLVCMFNRVLPSWISRKAIHMGMGWMMLHSDVADVRVRVAVHAVAWGFLALVITSAYFEAPLWRHMPFLHAKRVDPGVTTYLLTCSACVAYGVRFVDMGPLFFADPMGAVVGRTLRTPRLVGNKTWGGTLAVWLTAALTWNDTNLASCALGATLIAATELFAGDYDNPCIAGILMVRALVRA